MYCNFVFPCLHRWPSCTPYNVQYDAEAVTAGWSGCSHGRVPSRMVFGYGVLLWLPRSGGGRRAQTGTYRVINAGKLRYAQGSELFVVAVMQTRAQVQAQVLVQVGGHRLMGRARHWRGQAGPRTRYGQGAKLHLRKEISLGPTHGDFGSIVYGSKKCLDGGSLPKPYLTQESILSPSSNPLLS